MDTFLHQGKVYCLKTKNKSDMGANQQNDNSKSRDDFELPDRILWPEEYVEETSAGHEGMDSKKKILRNSLV